MDAFSAFFVGIVVGIVIGVFIMAVTLAIGQLREKGAYIGNNVNYDRYNNLLVLKNNEEIVKLGEGKYMIRKRIRK